MALAEISNKYLHPIEISKWQYDINLTNLKKEWEKQHFYSFDSKK